MTKTWSQQKNLLHLDANKLTFYLGSMVAGEVALPKLLDTLPQEKHKYGKK